MSRGVLIGLALIMIVSANLFVPAADAVPAFARQYDLQCNACHRRPPRLNNFGEQVHMMGFQIPSAARPGGLVQMCPGSIRRWSRSGRDIFAMSCDA
jgi:hypothetical protein